MSPRTVVLASDLRFPEGPVFTPDGRLWWVEIEGGGLGWLEGTERGFFSTGGRPNGAAVGADGMLWFCDQGACSVRRLDPATGLIATIVSHEASRPLGKPNDLAFDPTGHLVFTCPNDARTEPNGYVCWLAPDGRVGRVASDLYFPNGLAFLPDGRLVIAETYRHRLWIGAWDSAAPRWVDPKPWVETGGPIGPDGMAVGPDGHLFVAVCGRGHIARINPSGRIVGRIPTPGARPTNCCFDPGSPGRLIVTEAERGELLAYECSS